MSGKRALILCLGIAAVGLPAWLAAGCDRGGPSGQPSATGAGSVATSPLPGAAGAAPYADEDLPVEADFEAEAEREITDQSFDAVLSEIEKELDASVPDAAPDGSGADGGKLDGGKPDAGARPVPKGPPPKSGGAAPKPAPVYE